jgi:hypothetical protein
MTYLSDFIRGDELCPSNNENFAKRLIFLKPEIHAIEFSVPLHLMYGLACTGVSVYEKHGHGA